MVPSRRFSLSRPSSRRGTAPRRRPCRWAPIVALMLLAAVLAASAIVTAVTRQQVQLDDGTVWVTSLADRRAARFNVRAGQADASVAVDAARFDVLQQGSVTLIEAGDEIRSIRAATVDDAATVPAPRDGTLALGGGTAAVLDEASGEVRATAAEDLAGMDARSAPVRMALGRGGRIAVDHSGTVYGYRPADGMVMAYEPRTGDGTDASGASTKELGSLTGGSRRVADGFSVVAGTPVIVAGEDVLWAGGRATIGNGNGPDCSGGTCVLQMPPVDGEQRGWAAVGGPGGAYVVDFARSSVRFVATGGTGWPATPVSVQGTVHLAWAQPSRNYLALSAPGEDADAGSLRDVEATDRLVFRVNHRLVLLNDVMAGKAWRPQSSEDALTVAWQSMPTEQEDDDGSARGDGRTARYRHAFDDSCSAQSGRIRAMDDAFGARPGSRLLLDVLRNDEQTDCTVLRVASVGAPDRDDLTVTPALDGRLLQLDASQASAGEARFSYVIDDGHGQTASATVTLRLRDNGDTPPQQVDPPAEYEVERGAARTVNALDGFADAEGDAMALVAARMADGAKAIVSSRPDGQLTVRTGAAAAGRLSVQVTVSDGKRTGTGMLHFTVHPPDSLPPAVDPALVAIPTDRETTVALAPYVHAVSARPLTLRDATAPDGMTVTMGGETLTLTVRAPAPGTYDVPYAVAHGDDETRGTVRVEVTAPAQNDDPPVAVNDVVVLDERRGAVVEPLTNDRDPGGGVLALVQAHAEGAGGEGLDVATVGRRVIVTARGTPEVPLTVVYTAANARANAQGTIVVLPPGAGATGQAPQAGDFRVSVRTDGIVEAAVEDHVSGTDDGIRLVGDLRTADGFRGLAFVAEDVVRYQAPSEPGTHEATYTVADEHGRTASGTITFDVHAADAAHKAPARPRNVEAQTTAGRSTRIPIELSGIDADGDDVTLLGLGNAAPRLGRIVETQADALIYEAYPDAAGTDTFSYAVEDWTGQRAQATIRVGVIGAGGDAGVHARDDEITLRPGAAASVAVTINDIAGDDEPLTLDATVQGQGVDGRVCGLSLCLTAPREPGNAHLAYTVRNAAGLASTATLTVHVDPSATVEPPRAYDYRVPPAATIDRRSIDVDVSPWIANPSGSVDELAVGVHESAAAYARPAGGTVLRIALTERARAIAYTVTNTAHGLTTVAFVHVPAYGAFPPVPRPKAPGLTVNARETISIPIADHVRVGAGKTATVDASQPVTATKAGGVQIADEHTLRFTAAADYAGPASITFTAADGPAGQARRTAVITLPVTVVGRNVPAPTFSSATMDIEAGDRPTVVDLTALTHAPQGAWEDETRYTYTSSASSGASGPISATVTASGRLSVAAAMDAKAGTVTSIPIDIAYPSGVVHAGFAVRVVSSTRPLARLSDRTVSMAAERTAAVDPLAEAFNPFPDTPLRLVDVRAQGPEGLRAELGDDGLLHVTAGKRAGTGTVTVTAEDGTHAAERRVTGTITVQVSAVPDAPLLAPIAQDGQDGAVELRWTPGAENGSPITQYEVEYDGGTFPCALRTVCRITGLENGRSYRFTVKARNEIGWSPPSNAVDGRPDRVPEAPTGVTVTAGYREVSVDWTMPDYEGTRPEGYEVNVHSGNGFAASVEAESPPVRVTVPDAAITDSTAFTATVMARNRAGRGETSRPSEPALPWSDPSPPAVELRQGDDATSVVVTVSVADLRNAGCSAIMLGGAAERPGAVRTLDCARPTGRFTLDKRELGKPLTVTATLAAAKPGAAQATGSATLTPSYALTAPRTVTVHGEGDRCAVRWQPDGLHDGFRVTAAGRKPIAVGQSADSVSLQLAPWQRCGNVTVAQTLNGTTGPGATGASAYVRKVPASIDRSMALRWDANDRNLIHVSHGTVNLYGQRAQTVLIVGGRPVPWKPGQRTVRLDGSDRDSGGGGPDDGQDDGDPCTDAAGPGRAQACMWTLSVIGEDPALSASSGKPQPITGIRPPQSATQPGGQPFEDPSGREDDPTRTLTPYAGGMPRNANHDRQGANDE